LGLPAQNLSCINRIRNKSKLRNHLYENNLTSGPSLYIKAYDLAERVQLEKQNYPAIIKEVSGTGSRHVWLANDLDSAIAKISEIREKFFQGELTVEPYFQGSLYSVETLTWAGKTKVLAITSRKMSDEPLFREDGLSLPVYFPEAERQVIDTWISKVLESLDYNIGFAHTEFVITTNGMEVVEVNPRMGGAMVGEMLVRSFETNILKAHIELALGQRPEVMDQELTVKKGCANYLVYAKETGSYNDIDPGDAFSRFPGKPEFYSTIHAGKRIEHTDEYRALVGIIVTEGSTSEIAQINANAAANRIATRVQRISPLTTKMS